MQLNTYTSMKVISTPAGYLQHLDVLLLVSIVNAKTANSSKAAYN